MGTLKLYGYVRSRTLNANSLVYLPSLGTFQISEIYSLQRRNGEKKAEDWQLVQQADPSKQETLDVEAQYDEMNTEQTWPTEQELQEGKDS
jgi:pre-rRNA-processing protein TSR1